MLKWIWECKEKEYGEKKKDILKDKFEVYLGLGTDQTSLENLPLHNFMEKNRIKWA